MKANSQPVHGPFFGNEVNPGDSVSVEISKEGQNWTKVQVWRYSPFGIEFIVNKALKMSKGEKISLRIAIARDQTELSGIVISDIYEEEGQKLAGVRTFLPVYEAKPDKERREHYRWACGKEFLPTGTAPTPSRYNDFMFFYVEDLSAEGMRIITSMRNQMISIGQRFNATVSLPMVGSVNVAFQVRHIDTKMVNEKQQLILGTRLIRPNQNVKKSFAEYLLNFAEGVSVHALQDAGFPVRSISKWLDFSYVKNEAEYREVLALRYEAYKSAGKVMEGIGVDQMADEFDSRARILIAKFRNRIVGSVRMLFHNQGDKTDHERFVQYPADFPSITETVEASRLCTDHSMRGADIAYELLAHMLLATVKSGRRYVYSGATGSLLDFYNRCGWQLTGVRYKNANLSDIEHELILLDTYLVALGKGVGVRQWNKLYRSVLDYMLDMEFISPTVAESFRIGYYKLLGTFFR